MRGKKTIFYVQEGAVQGKGTLLKPFSSIKEAIALATKVKAEIVEVQLLEGHFFGNIKIDRPTRIIGRDSKKIKSPLLKKQKSKEIVLNGSIQNPNGHHLAIKNVQLEGACEFGILQKGGVLKIDNVIVRKNQGIGICLSESAYAIIRQVYLMRSTFSAIFIGGEGTKVVASNLIVVNNKVDPTRIENRNIIEGGAIEVKNKALFLAENCTISNNDYVGIYVHEEAKMHLRKSIVGTTKSIQVSSGSVGGHNFAFTSGAIVELRNINCNYADLAGIFIKQAYLTMRDSQVYGNTIGVYYEPPPDPSYCLDCLTNNCAFFDNGRNLDVSYLPTQNISNETPNCPTVEWE